tara:strand:+ start:478 stop:729 length:252 start_codon:yes stop_codon:yes gene_type:complete
LQKTRKRISCRGGWEVRVEEVHKDAGCESAMLGDKLDLEEIGKSSFLQFGQRAGEKRIRETASMRKFGQRISEDGNLIGWLYQ